MLQRLCGIVACACSRRRPTGTPLPLLAVSHAADERPFPRVLGATFPAFLCLVEGTRLCEVGPGVLLRRRPVSLSTGRL